jgi:hypothetical protein
MNVALWILASALAIVFLGAGLIQLAETQQRLAAAGLEWVATVGYRGVKLIGLLESIGAVGLILPAALGIVPILTPFAALGLALVMAAATVLHLRRHERQFAMVTVALTLLTAIVAWTRFGPYSFSS